MTTTTAAVAATSRGRPWRRLLAAPFGAATWRATAHVVLGLPLGLLGCVVVTTLLVLSAGLASLVVPGLALLALMLAATDTLSAAQRFRFAVFLDVHIAPSIREPDERRWWRRVVARAMEVGTWREIGYHVLAGVLSCVTFGAVIAAWAAGLVFATAWAHAEAWPVRPVFGVHLHDPMVRTGLTVIGLALLLAVPWVARAAADLEVAAARALLAHSDAEELERRVEALAESRAAVVDAADVERRRIERDLHDGAQQRLVSLAMNLGIARANAADAPPEVRDAIASAHEEAKLALTELRDFVRGLHPAVLNDRGLDAALSGIAANSVVPVRLRVELADRPSSTVEAVAYFVVSEALTNVAKHARASHVDVDVRRDGGVMRIVVTDDGRGGADPEGGTGLRGLARRVGSVDGTLRVSSPVGGPTVLTVELPCVS